MHHNFRRYGFGGEVTFGAEIHKYLLNKMAEQYKTSMAVWILSNYQCSYSHTPHYHCYCRSCHLLQTVQNLQYQCPTFHSLHCFINYSSNCTSPHFKNHKFVGTEILLFLWAVIQLLSTTSRSCHFATGTREVCPIHPTSVILPLASSIHTLSSSFNLIWFDLEFNLTPKAHKIPELLRGTMTLLFCL